MKGLNRLTKMGTKIGLLLCIIVLSGCGHRYATLRNSDKLIIAPAGSVILRPDGHKEIVNFDGVVVSLDEIIDD